MRLSIAEPAAEFLAVSQQAIVASGAPEALATLGWFDLLSQIDDTEMRFAVFAFFRAQGHALASSAALGALLAEPFMPHLGLQSGDVVAAIRRDTPKGAAHVVVGDPSGRQLLIDVPGHGAYLVDPATVNLTAITVPGHLALSEAHLDLSGATPVVAEALAAPARLRSEFLGRLAMACEMLGAAERSVEIATEYATDRRQFGSPIGTFQAIRHLLAWAKTDCIAIEAVTYLAIDQDVAAPPMTGEIVKALSGRNGRRVCERTLQVLGGIGFTAEHDHHHLHSRVLALDGLLGTSAELTHQLGANLRTSATHPGLPAAAIQLVSG